MKIEIRTNRCTIRNFIKKDIDGFVEYRNDLEWMKYQGFKGLTKEEYMDVLLKDYALEKGLQLAVIDKEKDIIIGDTFIKKDGDNIWVGYTINPKYARQGFAYEVLMGMLNWFEDIGEMNICAGVEPGNIPSIKLLEKAGFICIGFDKSGEKVYKKL